ncbi:MAG: hypothetical protein L3J63_04585, partial [Geopsychrobacter sp.]|nr:hypothetical protein [Geopsychrobacter sp.]
MSKKLKIVLLAFVLLLPAVRAFCAEANPEPDKPILLELQKQEGLSSTRISMLFDRIPEFTFEHSAQRLDILLSKVSVSKGLTRLPEDETVVKILLAQKGDEILVSLLLRRPPKQIVSKSQENPARIDFDLYWDSARGSRPAVAFRIEGIPGRKGGRKVREERKFPPWHENWRQLFKADLTPWTLDPELNFSLPQLPEMAMKKPSAALKQRLELVKQKRWLSLVRFLPEMPPVAAGEKLLEELLVIESLMRTDRLDAAGHRLAQLEGIKGEFKSRVDYLTDFVLAANGQAFAAFLKIQEQLKRLPKQDSFSPLMVLLAAESAIASGNDKDVAVLLKDKKITWPEQLKPLVLMRLGDADSGLGKFPEEMEQYRKLVDGALLFEHYPRSRGRAAKAAFKVGKYRLAARFFKKLGHQLEDQPRQDLAFYAAAAANYDAGETEWAQIGLQKIFLEMPGTEGAE